jgi:hypothetical protein
VRRELLQQKLVDDPAPFTAPSPSRITLTKVAGVLPLDSFSNNGNACGNIEGDCWFADALYVSEISVANRRESCA